MTPASDISPRQIAFYDPERKGMFIHAEGGIRMRDEILKKMERGVYYPGNHLGKRHELTELVANGYLNRMDGSFLCGPDSEPNYCLTEKGLLQKHQKNRIIS